MVSVIRRSWLLAALAVLLTACSGLQASSPTSTPLPPSATPPPPTATSPPAAALVNGTPIWLSDYQAELERFNQAQAEAGTELATNQEAAAAVINALIDLELLAQEAQRSGISISEEQISQEIDRLAEATGANETTGALDGSLWLRY